MTIDISTLDEFTTAYLEAALWSSMDYSEEGTGGDPLDANYGIGDIHPDTLAEMVADCADFRESFGALVDDDLGKAGHMFWLTRNRHGAGFWDGDYEGRYYELDDEGNQTGRTMYPTLGDFLTAMSHPYGEFNLHVGDDGMIHGS